MKQTAFRFASNEIEPANRKVLCCDRERRCGHTRSVPRRERRAGQQAAPAARPVGRARRRDRVEARGVASVAETWRQHQYAVARQRWISTAQSCLVSAWESANERRCRRDSFEFLRRQSRCADTTLAQGRQVEICLTVVGERRQCQCV